MIEVTDSISKGRKNTTTSQPFNFGLYVTGYILPTNNFQPPSYKH